MTELLSIFKEFTPGAYGIWSLVIMGAGWFLREWRETRKMTAEDRLARRDGYAKQVGDLMAENRSLRREIHEERASCREEIAALRKEQEDHRVLCKAETDQLRAMVVNNENEIEGLKRRVATDAVEILRLKGNPL